MKKLVFAAVAALALVSVSNVFAGQNENKVQNTVVSDTTVTTPGRGRTFPLPPISEMKEMESCWLCRK